jgi:Phage terminase large subunit (GpA)
MIENHSTPIWIAQNDIKTETGDSLDFHKYRFMYDVYADKSPLITCMKCAQIGFTTYEILKTAHECKNDGIDIIYVLPTGDDVKKFSGGKTNKMIAQNPVLQTWTKDKDSVEQKQFGENTIYYQGSWTERAALMITAKKLVVDEYDRCKQQIVEQYDSRLQSIANPKKAFFSNPSAPDFGVDKWYKLSDMKKWHITHSCGQTYVMDESCVDYEAQIYRCPKCQGEITDEERRMGEWIPTNPKVTREMVAEGLGWSGYWIPLWIAPWMPARKIAEAKKDKTPEYFANFVAGTPYIGGGNKVSRDDVAKNLIAKSNYQEGTIVIGIDTGLPIHYVIGNKEGLFFYGKTDGYEVFEDYLKRWPNAVIVSDQGGDLIGIRKLQEKYPGRVFLCWYRTDRKTQQIIQWGEGDEYGKVIVDRNRALQLLIDEMRETRLPLYGEEGEWHEYITHWLNIYRTKEENALGVMEYKWERTGPDHFVHATNYWRVGIDKYAESMASVVGDDPLAGLPVGRVF